MARKKKKRPARQPSAYWTPSGIFETMAKCSACGFEIQATLAVETGWAMSDFTGVKYKFCPSCGKPMLVKNNDAERTSDEEL